MNCLKKWVVQCFPQGWPKIKATLLQESVYICVMMLYTSNFLKGHFIDWQIIFWNTQTYKKISNQMKTFFQWLNERPKCHFNWNWWLIFASWERKVAAMLQWKKPNVTFIKILKYRFKEWRYYWNHKISSKWISIIIPISIEPQAEMEKIHTQLND